MKFALGLFSMTSLTFLGACSPQITTTECSWAEEIRFSDETKDWLQGLDWPQSAYADFDKIGDHNELHQRFCI